MNKVILMGRLTRDVEMRQTPNGVSLARFSIAVNRRFAGKDAQQQADFINCVAWRQTGEFIARYFQKGSMIAVVGSIQSRSWDGNDGKKQYATEVVVDEAYFTGSRAESGTQGGGNYQNQGFNQGGFTLLNRSLHKAVNQTLVMILIWAIFRTLTVRKTICHSNIRVIKIDRRKITWLKEMTDHREQEDLRKRFVCSA